MKYTITTRMDFYGVIDVTRWLRDRGITRYKLDVPPGRDFIYIWQFACSADATLFMLTYSDKIVLE